MRGGGPLLTGGPWPGRGGKGGNPGGGPATADIVPGGAVDKQSVQALTSSDMNEIRGAENERQ